MSEIEENIASLRTALAQGAKRVLFRSGGTQREVEYNSMAEMREYLASLEAKTGVRRKVTLASF